MWFDLKSGSSSDYLLVIGYFNFCRGLSKKRTSLSVRTSLIIKICIMRSRLPWPDRPGFKGLLRSFIAIKDTSFLRFWHARYTVVQPCINLWKANYRRWRFMYVHNLTLCYFQLSSLLLIYNCELCTMCRAECKSSKKVILTKRVWDSPGLPKTF